MKRHRYRGLCFLLILLFLCEAVFRVDGGVSRCNNKACGFSATACCGDNCCTEKDACCNAAGNCVDCSSGDDDFTQIDDNTYFHWNCGGSICFSEYNTYQRPNGCCQSNCCYGDDYCCDSITGNCVECENGAHRPSNSTSSSSNGIIAGIMLAFCSLSCCVFATKRMLMARRSYALVHAGPTPAFELEIRHAAAARRNNHQQQQTVAAQLQQTQRQILQQQITRELGQRVEQRQHQQQQQQQQLQQQQQFRIPSTPPQPQSHPRGSNILTATPVEAVATFVIPSSSRDSRTIPMAVAVPI